MPVQIISGGHSPTGETIEHRAGGGHHTGGHLSQKMSENTLDTQMPNGPSFVLHSYGRRQGMTSLTPATGGKTRGVPAEGVGGFSQCWYPVALSSEVAKGQVVGREFLDGRVIVYRGDDGEARVQSAYCRHLGADLAVGEVQGNDVVCAFHHWQYGPDGMCTKIPAGVKAIPRQARLFAYPTVETLGLVWAFNGVEPLYPVPSFPTYPTDSLEVRPVETRSWPVPPYVLLTNSMDFQHLQVVHGMTLDAEPADIEMEGYQYEYEVDGKLPNFGRMHQRIKCFGNNTITFTMSVEGGPEILAAFAGVPTRAGCRGFNLAAAPRGDGGPDDEARVEQALSVAHAMVTQLQEQDEPILDTIRFREDVLIEADKALIKFFRYLREYPRTHPGDGLIN